MPRNQKLIIINLAIMLGGEKGIVLLALISESHRVDELILRDTSITLFGFHTHTLCAVIR